MDINYEKIFQAIFTKSLLKVTLLPVSFSHFLNCTNGIKLCNASDIFQTNCMSLQLYTVKSVESYKLHHEKNFYCKASLSLEKRRSKVILGQALTNLEKEPKELFRHFFLL